jgi:hypothetical protein
MVMVFSVTFNNISKQKRRTLYPVQGLMLWGLTSLSTLFQVFRGSQFYWWRKPEYPQKTTFMKTISRWQPDNCRSDYFGFLFCFENKSLKNINI